MQYTWGKQRIHTFGLKTSTKEITWEIQSRWEVNMKIDVGEEVCVGANNIQDKSFVTKVINIRVS